MFGGATPNIYVTQNISMVSLTHELHMSDLYVFLLCVCCQVEPQLSVSLGQDQEPHQV